jgi:hypothetical protein
MSGINDIEILLCGGLLGFLVWKEVRAARTRLWWRLIATVIAVAALAGMILPLSLRHRAKEVHRVLSGPFKAAEGIVRIEWRRRLYTGERLKIDGRWEGQPGSGPVKLILMGFGTAVDSVRTTGEFSLGVVPAQTGKAVYRLAAVSGQDTIEQEAIPVEVGHEPPMKILILAASPDFENVFLVNWLAKNGQQVAVRTAVSRDKYQTSYVNMKPRPLGWLTRALLDEFDVVIADEAVMELDGSVLRREVKEKGIGLIVRMDSVRIRKTLSGMEKVVYTALDTTYVRMMTGQSAGYATYWADLLRRAGRPVASGESWEWEPAEPRVGEEVRMTLQSGEAAPQGVMVQDGRVVSVYLAEDAVLPFVWHGRYWPEEAGWVRMNDSGWMYVWPRESWPALGRQDRFTKTDRVESEPVPKYWMYTAFLLSIFFLWVEKKFS